MLPIKDARLAAANFFLTSPNLKKHEYEKNSALLDADILLSFLLKKERSWLLLHSDFDISEFKNEFETLKQKRFKGLPIAYLTGEKYFYGKKFYVTPAVLIPKPDTETLVERLCVYMQNKLQKDGTANFFILDMCTGSGCIGISAACELNSLLNKKFKNNEIEKKTFIKNKFALMLADISEEVLTISKKNMQELLPKELKERTRIIKTDLRKPFPVFENNIYGIITANPPYIPSKLTEELLADGRGEPRLALDGGEAGLDLIKPLAENAFTALSANGKIFTEIGEYHSNAAADIFKQAGFINISVIKDLSGKDRIIEAEKPAGTI